MDEAQIFIKEGCKRLDCTFANDEFISFDTPQVFELMIKAIWVLLPESKTVITNHVYPRQISKRVDISQHISNYLEKLRIRGNIAFHNILYGSLTTLQNIFIDLIRALPTDAIDEGDDSNELHNAISQNLENQQPWVPIYCRRLGSKVPDTYPEVFTFGEPCSTKYDPRNWIASFLEDSAIESKSLKPMLPPKPVLSSNPCAEEVQAMEELDEHAKLVLKYEGKLAELHELQAKKQEVEDENKALNANIQQYSKLYVETLVDPETYIPKLEAKIEKLRLTMEADMEQASEVKQELRRQLKEVLDECKAKGIEKPEEQQMRELEKEMEESTAEIERNNRLVKKLTRRLEKIDWEENFEDFEKRGDELREIVRKQEEKQLKMQEDRVALRKCQERESEAIDRSFRIAYQHLQRHFENNRGRSGLESFNRIHSYCLELMDTIKSNGDFKISIEHLKDEIEKEDEKNYGKTLEMMNADIAEIEKENEELVEHIRQFQPDFEVPELGKIQQ